MAPATNWSETIAEGEAARFERYGEDLNAIQKRVAKGGGASRALHAKQHAGLDAEFTVLPELPPYARVGIFAAPATHRAFVRFSNGAARRQSDKRPDVRGLAIKVVGVGGKKLIVGLEDARTQDFLMIQSASVPFKNADEFVGLVRVAQNPATLLPRAIRMFGIGRTFQLLRAFVSGTSVAMGSLATQRFYSALPVQWGPYAVHYAVFPRATPDAQAKTPDDLGLELGERLRSGPVVFDFRVQFFVDAERTPIEDPTVEWLERVAPFETVARLTLPRQDVASARGRELAVAVEKLSFDPWHAPVEFRPLGSLMRARNVAYRYSTKERGASPEPDETTELTGLPGLPPLAHLEPAEANISS